MQTDKQPSSTGWTWMLAIVLGIVVAGLQDGFGGFVVGALLGVSLAQVLHLRTQLKRQSERIEELQFLQETRSEPPAEQPAASPPPQPAPAPAPRPAQPRQAPIFDKATEIPAPVARTQTPPIAVTAATPVAQPAPSPLPRRPAPPPVDTWTDKFIRWFKGGNPLARVGIVILFFGAVFLAKYAAENNLFPIELRFIALAIGAFALLIIGWRLRDQQPMYAQLLQGGGIAGLYLTVFAASRLYQLLPLGLALALLVVIALAAAILAVAQNALSLAVIGTAGGFMAPIMVSSGGGNHIALFTYYTILNLGIFTVAWFRTWRVLNVLGFVFTFTITGLWRAHGYQPHDLYSADFFLILFFLMYVGVSILNCVRQPPDLKGYVSGSLVFGLPVVAFAQHAALVSKIEFALAWSALTLGAFYIALGWTLWRSGRETFRLLVEAFTALGVIFASLAIPLAFDTRTTAAMWAVEGCGLLWLGMRQDRKLARAFGSLLQAAAGVGFIMGLHGLHSAQPVLNSVYLGAVMLGVAGLLSSYWWRRNADQQADHEGGAETLFAVWGLAWWLFAGLHEIHRYAHAVFLGAALGYVAITAIVLAFIGRRARWPLPQTFALYLPALGCVLGVALVADAGHPFAQWGESGWLLLLAVHYGLLFLLDVNRLDANASGARALHAGAYWLLTLLIAWEVSWYVESHASGVWPSLPWGLAPALMLALLARKRLVPAWPLAKFADMYRAVVALPLAIATGAWVVIINFTNVGDPAWLPYIPLLNPLDVSVAVCLAALALWWTSLDTAQRDRLWAQDERSPIAVIAGIVFLWLNAALIRALHYGFGAPVTAHGIMNSTLIQASLSIFWGLLGFAAMTLAARQKWRYVWIVGATLMVIVVAKLFLVDLSKVGTIARIASFLTVGLLLLITGYLAPLPPRHAGEGVVDDE